MIPDIITVAWKELREMFVQGDPHGRSKMSLILLVIIFGIVLPLQNGRDWVSSPISIMVWGWMPFLWVSGIVADSFAGERERHTLESLLSTRLSDRAILIGKLLSALLYGCILTWINLLVSLITVNVAFGHGELLLFSLPLSIGAISFSILVSGLAASVGVLVSLRAGSVRQAQQLMSFGMLALFIPLMLVQFLPLTVRQSLIRDADKINPTQVVLWIAVVLLILDAILTAIGMYLFQRSKLILD
jgi:ABC-2 type transport system permease protein